MIFLLNTVSLVSITSYTIPLAPEHSTSVQSERPSSSEYAIRLKNSTRHFEAPRLDVYNFYLISLQCSSDAEAYDSFTHNCNFRHDIRYCPEYDHITHCSTFTFYSHETEQTN